jgi:hypothetical protein
MAVSTEAHILKRIRFIGNEALTICALHQPSRDQR